MEIPNHLMERLASLSVDGAQALVGLAEFRQLDKNEPYVREGDTKKTIAIVSAGILRGYFQHDAKEHTFGFVQPNKVAGNLDSILLGQASGRFFSPVGGPVSLWEFDYEAVDTLLLENPAWEHIRSMLLAEILGDVLTWTRGYVVHSPEERYAILEEQYPELLQQVPLKYLASWIGVTDVTLSRIRRRRLEDS